MVERRVMRADTIVSTSSLGIPGIVAVVVGLETTNDEELFEAAGHEPDWTASR